MEIGSLALSAAQTLFSALQCPQLKEMSSIFGYKSQLDELQRTVAHVRAVLRDAEAKQKLSEEEELWIEELKDAVYDADDLFDEFVTLAERKQKQIMEGGKAIEKVRLFFSRSNPFGVAFNMSQGVKKIRKKLDDIASNHSQFGFGVNSEPIRRRREETCSYVYEGSIIGREEDLDKIVGFLLDSNVERDVSFLSIVGVGGLGKTALAQLVFNDARVTSSFSTLRMWTCVSDHEQEQLDVEGILRKILTSATGDKHEGLPMEEVQRRLAHKLASNKYLLVLDDVWTENRTQWLNLEEFLLRGHRGSWILVTTRSQETARIVDSDLVHELQGLSEKDSWSLFEKVAFGSKKLSSHDDLVQIGQEIVAGCAGVPLALRVVGSLLYGQDKSKWLSVQEMGLANIRESKNDIMSILKLSYNNLESPLKSCFSYCALFPKDFEIKKESLIRHWMAQGYVVPLDEGQSIEDAVEEYFSILLRRCFFQVVRKDSISETLLTCKIHDLMHDIAQKVAGKEICISNSTIDGMDIKVRHLALMRNEYTKCSFTRTHIRSYLQNRVYFAKMDPLYLKELLANFKYLRAVDLSRSGIESLPWTIGELLHLRYLDLSWNENLEVLPKSMKKLCNLETLNLSNCRKLKELPKDISKLVKLRVLDIGNCESLTCLPSDMGNKLTNLRVLDISNCNLTCMPCGLGNLTNLHRLPWFMLRKASPSCKEWFNQLKDLKALKSLKGSIYFDIRSPKNGQIDGQREGGYLKNKEHISYIRFSFSAKEVDETAKDTEEALMEELQPHTNLKKLELWGYHGVRMPSWAISLTNLVEMVLIGCDELQQLTCLGNLLHLKMLILDGLQRLEYIIENSNEKGLSFLPSLQRLIFYHLPKLKAWGTSGVIDDLQVVGSSKTNVEEKQFLCLSQLKSLAIRICPELTSFPLCPTVESLSLIGFNEGLQIIRMTKETDEKGEATSPTTPSSSSLKSLPNPKLRGVRIDNVRWLKSLPMESFQHVTHISITGDKNVECLGEVGEVFSSCSSSLQYLYISDCDKLTSVSEGLKHLTALERLTIQATPSLNLSEEEERKDGSIDIGMPWQPLQHSLQTLQFWFWKELESLPSWMSKLTSLRELRIIHCSKQLEERCQYPSGDNWPYIQHIPKIYINYSLVKR